MSVKVEQAAKRFFYKITGGLVPWDYTDHKAKPLCLAAFQLYHQAWGKGFNISHWEWPFTAFANGEGFNGDEPWTVLLRRALEIARVEV
jgi:hypothetical protein